MDYWALIFFSLALVALLFGTGSITNSVAGISLALGAGALTLAVAAGAYSLLRQREDPE